MLGVTARPLALALGATGSSSFRLVTSGRAWGSSLAWGMNGMSLQLTLVLFKDKMSPGAMEILR